MRDIVIRTIQKPWAKALVVSFVGIALNIVAAAIKVSFLWILAFLALALICSFVMEASEVAKENKRISSGVDRENKRVSFKIEPSASWLQLIRWALVYAFVGALVAFIALVLPISQKLTLFHLFGGLSGFAFYWYWYNVLSVTVISGLALIIGIWRRSIAQLILFVLFSTIGMTVVIAGLEPGTSIFYTYTPAAIVALVIGGLTFGRSRIVDILRETWGRSHPMEQGNSSKAKQAQGWRRLLKSTGHTKETATDDDASRIEP